MEIVYCDKCGLRIPPDAVTSGVMADGKVLCDKCRPASAPPVPAVARRSSGNSHPVVAPPLPLPVRTDSGSRQSTVSAPAAQRNTRKTATLPRTAVADKTTPRMSEAQSQNGMMIGVGLAGGCAALLGLFFMFSGNNSEKKPARTAAATTPATPNESRSGVSVETTALAQKSPPITPALAPASPLPIPTPPATTPAPANEPRRAESHEAAVKLSTGGLLGNPAAKSDPDTLADAAFDKVLVKIAKEEAPAKISALEEFVKDVDQNTMAAARARAMVSALKKAEEAAKAPPPAPPPPIQAVASSNMGAKADAPKALFKEDFETTAYGIHFGKLSSKLPGGRTGKAMQMLGSDNDRRGGIYTYAYPQDSQVFKTSTLTTTTDGMKISFKYYSTNFSFEVLVGYFAPGTDTICYAKTKLENMTKGAWADAEFPLNAFKVDGGGTLPANARIHRIEFWGYGAGDAYIDDIEFAPAQ